MTIDTPTILTILNLLAGSSVVAGILVSILTRRKTHAETAKLIQEAAGQLIERYRDHNQELIQECSGLKLEMDDLKVKHDRLSAKLEEQSSCQDELTRKITDLEREKKILTEQIAKLTEQVEELQAENRRLKQERDSEKGLIA